MTGYAVKRLSRKCPRRNFKKRITNYCFLGTEMSENEAYFKKVRAIINNYLS